MFAKFVSKASKTALRQLRVRQKEGKRPQKIGGRFYMKNVDT